jgi:tetratricopeptide (TPR) repeat protein
MKSLLYILAVLFCVCLGHSQNEQLFNDGNALYNQGNYAEAIDKYMAILETNVHSPELYFNLANAHYKLNHVAPSIFYYEKALLLQPKNTAVQNNLGFAHNMTIDAIDTLPEVGVSKWIKNLSHTLSYDAWAVVTILLAFCFLAFVLAYYFSFTSAKKRIAFVGSTFVLIGLCVTLALAFHKFNLDQKNNPAIVFAQESLIKTEPNLRSENAFKLHEGAKVLVLDEIGKWNEIKLSDGKKGWIPSEDIKALKAL